MYNTLISNNSYNILYNTLYSFKIHNLLFNIQKKIFFLLFLFFFFFAKSAFAQQEIDILEKRLKNATGRDEIEILISLADEYLIQHKELKIAFSYSLKALQKAQNLKYPFEGMKAKNILGNCHLEKGEKGDIDKAFEYYKNALSTPRKNSQEEEREEARSLNGLANVYYLWGYYKEALSSTEKALSLRKKYTDERGMAQSYNTLGQIADAAGDYKNAINYYSKALNLYEKLRRQRDIAGVLDNLASAIKVQAQIDGKTDFTQVLQYYNRSLEISNQLKDGKGIARTFNNLGIIAANEKRYEKALEYYEEAIRYSEENENLQGLPTTFNNIAEVYYNQEDYPNALKFYEKAADIANNIGATSDLQETFLKMSRLFAKQQKFEDAYEMLRLSNLNRDKIANEENIKRISSYEMTQKQTEIDLLRTEKQLEAKTFNAYALMLAVIACFVLIIILVLYRKNAIITELNEELKKK